MLDRLLWRSAARAIYTLAAAALFAVCGNSHATNYFAWGVEGCAPPGTPCAATSGYFGAQANFVWYSTPKTSVSTSVFHSGARSMKLLPDGIGTDEHLGVENIYALANGIGAYPGTFLGSTLYYRWWMRIEPGFDWGVWNGSPRLKLTRTQAADSRGWYTSYIHKTGFEISECDNSGYASICYSNSNSIDDVFASYDMDSMDDGQWHEYIMLIKINSSASCTPGSTCDSQFRIYIDGSLATSHDGFKMVPQSGSGTAQYEQFGLAFASPYFQFGAPSAIGGTIYVDDLSIDDVWNSTFSGGDTTAPTVPTSLSCPSSTTTGITCTWSASTDAVGVTSYPLERRSLPDGGAWTQIAAPAGTSYADTVPATTRYEYRVSAKDAAGNQSAPSTSATATSHTNLAFGYGVNLPLEFRDGTWDAGQREAALDAIEFMCGTSCWVRMDVTHSTVEATQGVYDWSSYDTRIAEINAHGFQKMLMLGYSPAWNRDGACSTSNALPVSGAAFGAFVGAAVARLTPDAVEFWNEPNSLGFSCPAVSATNYYANVLEPGYNAAKAARPATAVISGGTGPATDVGCTGTTPNVTCTTSRTSIGWLTDLYGIATAKEHWDGIGFHPYTNSTQPPGTAYTTGLGTGWMQMEQRTEGSGSLRTLMTNNAQSALKIVTTEWGIPTSGSGNMGSVSVTSQANDWVKQGFGILAGKSWAGPSVWYVLTDRCATTANEECWFGLLQQDLVTKKRSFGAFKALANPLAAPGRDKFRPR